MSGGETNAAPKPDEEKESLEFHDEDDMVEAMSEGEEMEEEGAVKASAADEAGPETVIQKADEGAKT